MDARLDKLKLGDLEVYRTLYRIFEEHPHGLSLVDLSIALNNLGVHPTKNITQWLRKHAEKIGLASLLDSTQEPSTLTVPARTVCMKIAAWLDEVDDFIKTGAGREGVRRRVRIGMTNSLTSNLLPAIMRKSAFLDLKSMSRVDLKVVDGEPFELERFVQTGWTSFAIAPGAPPQELCEFEPLCKLDRVLIFNPQATYPSDDIKNQLVRWSKNGCDSIPELQAVLQELTVIIPPRSVMPQLEERILPTPTTGRRVKLPQAAQRRSWVRQGFGVAFAHQDIFGESALFPADSISEIRLPEILKPTELCLYLPKAQNVKDGINSATTFLIEAIRKTVAEYKSVSD